MGGLGGEDPARFDFQSIAHRKKWNLNWCSSHSQGLLRSPGKMKLKLCEYRKWWNPVAEDWDRKFGVGDNGREGSSRIQQVKWSFPFLGAVSSGSRMLFLNHTYLTTLSLSQPRFSPGYIKITKSKESIISECGIPAIPCLNPVIIFFFWSGNTDHILS